MLGFEFGCLRRLHVRRESLALGLQAPVRLLYASDLHLGHWWTRSVPGQLEQAAGNTGPDVILLGGDLVDRASAVPALARLIHGLLSHGPVLAIPGNHDPVASLREAVRDAGAVWLPDESVQRPLQIDASVRTIGGVGPRLLCAHDPCIFPQAMQAGYRLVLAGHLHGGQCVLACVRDKLYPAAWFHRWHVLRHHEGGTTMWVSRGVADTFPIRFRCPREVLLCEFR